MQLTAIHLKNYRAHQDIHVAFRPGFNLIAGVNGSGKTSLLKGVVEGLTVALNGAIQQWLGNALEESDCIHIQAHEFEGRCRFEPQFPVTVEVWGQVLTKDFSVSATKSMDGAQLNIKGQVPIHKAFQSHTNHSFPLIAFYRANRQWLTNRGNLMQAVTEKASRMDGYKGWQDAAADASAFQQWVIGKCLERYQRSSETGKRFHEIDDDELALVNKALTAAIDGMGDLRYDLSQKNLLVHWHLTGEEHTTGEEPRATSFDHLSDGQRAVICLVADIARRICLLNPQLGQEVIKKTPGVVLIDELDVHLHPNWQRRIVTGLKKTFPAIQFIVTSHSPQILGELQPEEIILLHENGTSQPQISYGLTSSQVLEAIMGASPRSQHVAQTLKQLFLKIENNQIAEAKVQLQTLREQAPDIPELGGAEALIRRKETLGR